MGGGERPREDRHLANCADDAAADVERGCAVDVVGAGDARVGRARGEGGRVDVVLGVAHRVGGPPEDGPVRAPCCDRNVARLLGRDELVGGGVEVGRDDRPRCHHAPFALVGGGLVDERPTAALGGPPFEHEHGNRAVSRNRVAVVVGDGDLAGCRLELKVAVLGGKGVVGSSCAREGAVVVVARVVGDGSAGRLVELPIASGPVVGDGFGERGWGADRNGGDVGVGELPRGSRPAADLVPRGGFCGDGDGAGGRVGAGRLHDTADAVLHASLRGDGVGVLCGAAEVGEGGRCGHDDRVGHARDGQPAALHDPAA